MDILDIDLRSIQEVRSLINKAKKQQMEFSSLWVKEIDEIVRCMAELAYINAEHLAEIAVLENRTLAG